MRKLRRGLPKASTGPFDLTEGCIARPLSCGTYGRLRRRPNQLKCEVRDRASSVRRLLPSTFPFPLSAPAFQLWSWLNVLHLADITSDSTISIAVTKVVIS